MRKLSRLAKICISMERIGNFLDRTCTSLGYSGVIMGNSFSRESGNKYGADILH
jgi:hypothetical protein